MNVNTLLTIIFLFFGVLLAYSSAEPREYRVLNSLSRGYSSGRGLVIDDLLTRDKDSVAMDKTNEVVCVISENKDMVFFIYSGAYGVGRFAMAEENGLFLSVGSSRSESTPPRFAKLKCLSSKKASFEVLDESSNITRRVAFAVDRTGKQQIKWDTK